MLFTRTEHKVENEIELKWCNPHDEGVGAWLDLEAFGKNASAWDNLTTSCKICIKKTREKNRDRDNLRSREWYKNHQDLIKDYRKEHKEKTKKQYKEWRNLNKEEVQIKEKEYRDTHKDYYSELNKKYYVDHKEEFREYRQKYYKENVGELQRYSKQYAKEHPEVGRKSGRKRRENITTRLSANVSCAIWCSLRDGKGRIHWEFLVGYTLTTLIAHLESLFESWMTWENYGWGPGKWVIDHIKPIVAFNFNSYKDPEFLECWALSNLRPLSYEENRDKNSRHEGILIRRRSLV